MKKNKDKWLINRIYKCHNEKCGILIEVEQNASDDWIKDCPECNEESLLLESGTSSFTTFIDLNKPKTIGTLAEKNRDIKIKRGESVANDLRKKKPFWRKNNKINYNILKNKTKYITEGTI